MSQIVPKVDYSKSLIYKIVCNDTNIKNIYIGSSTNLGNLSAAQQQGDLARLQMQGATAAQQQDVPLSIKFELARLEKKIDDVADRLENQIEEKIQKLGNRIDEKISTIIQLLELQPGVQVQRIRRNEYQVQERGRDPRSVQQDPIASDDILADCHLSSSSST